MSNISPYFPVKCPQCNWIGSSEHAAGGEPIADTGDYSDVICPKCFKKGEGVSVILEDATMDEYEQSLQPTRTSPMSSHEILSDKDICYPSDVLALLDNRRKIVAKILEGAKWQVCNHGPNKDESVWAEAYTPTSWWMLYDLSIPVRLMEPDE